MTKKEKIARKTANHNIPLYVILTVGFLAFIVDKLCSITCEPIIEVSKLVQTIITVIAGMWITCYLLFIELYKDRYPLESLRKELLPSMRDNFVLVSYSVIYGCMLVFFNYSFWGCVCFLIVSFFTIAVIFIDVYNAHKTLMVSSYINNFFKRASIAFNTHTQTIDSTCLNEIKYIFDESLVKEEYYTAQNIILKTGVAFRDYLGNLIKISDQVGVTDVQKSFKEIVTFNIDQLKLCKNIKSELLISVLIKEQAQNLNYCIDHKQYEWFKLYIHKYNLFLFKMQKEENVFMEEKLYGVYYRLLNRLIEEDKKEWVDYLLEDIETLTMTYIYMFNKTNIRNYVMLLVDTAEMCIENNWDRYYDTCFEKIKKFTNTKHLDHGMFNEVKAFYASLFVHLLKEDTSKALRFTEIVLDKNVTCQEDSPLLEFKLYAITELAAKKADDISHQDRLFQYHINVLVEAIGLNKDYNGYLILPDFYSRINKQDCTKERIEDTVNAVKRLLHNCIIKDHLPLFYTLLKELRDSLEKTSQQQKEVQKNILSIYFWLFRKTIVLVNQQFFELTFDFFQQSLECIDKNNAISIDLGNYIINRISKAYSGMRRDNEKLTILSIDLLFSFLEEGQEYHFVFSNPDQKRFLYRNLFNIGTDCIENNFEEGLRKVSNSLGWLIIFSLKQTTHGLTKYLIGRAGELFYLSKEMDISEKTQMFMLTLFTTVGAYCCKDPSNKSHLNSIIKAIQDESIDRVKNAISLRTSENDMWNELFENKTKHLTEEFLKAFEHNYIKS